MDREYFYCPLDDGEDFPGSTNCGGKDFGSRLALDMHYLHAHHDAAEPALLAVTVTAHPRKAAAARATLAGEYANVLRDLHPFIASEKPDFHGAPPIPGSHGWGMLGAAAGIGQGLPQARYVVWSQGTPIAWYLNDRSDEGWVFPEGDYYVYDRVTSSHQARIGAALRVLAAEKKVTPQRSGGQELEL